MIIEHIDKAKERFRREIKKNFMRFTLYLFINIALMFLGGIMFFYVEECYFFGQKENSPETNKQCLELCEDIKQFNTTHSAKIQDGQILESLSNITSSCIGKCQTGETTPDKQCHLDEKGMMTWSEYTFTIHFTIGEIPLR